MRILIISDSHDHIANIKSAMEIGIKAHAEAVIHCGDWGGVKAVEAVLSYNLPLYSILGNADIDDGMETYMQLNCKKFDPDFLKVTIEGRKIGITHQARMTDPRHEDLSVIFSGHYHSSEEKMVNFTKYIRPGALINGINLAVYETETNEVEFIEDTLNK
jgi:uncharacterized protein